MSTILQQEVNLTILKDLGQGAWGQVCLARDQHELLSALKIFDLSRNMIQKSIIAREAEIQSKLSHPNIVKCFGFSLNSTDTDFSNENLTQAQVKQSKKAQVPKNCAYMQLEYCQGGEFFDYVLQYRFPPKYCRFFFKQMLSALEHIHEEGFSHRDIKLENMLFDQAYNLKIADFGYATYTQKELTTKQGTERYMAPELNEVYREPGNSYSGAEVDLFALGVILFIMYAGYPPFAQATRSDIHYKLFYLNQVNQFWRWHQVGKNEDFFGDSDFKDLISKMLAFKPSDRLTLEQIKKHPWMQGETTDQKTVQQRFKIRADKLIEQKLTGLKTFTQTDYEEEDAYEDCYEGGEQEQLIELNLRQQHITTNDDDDVYMVNEEEIAAPCAQHRSDSEDVDMLTDTVEMAHHIHVMNQEEDFDLENGRERAQSLDPQTLRSSCQLQLPVVEQAKQLSSEESPTVYKYEKLEQEPKNLKKQSKYKNRQSYTISKTKQQQLQQYQGHFSRQQRNKTAAVIRRCKLRKIAALLRKVQVTQNILK